MPAFVVTGLLAIAVPDVGWTAAAWLLPSVCMAAVTMVLASWLPVRAVAGGGGRRVVGRGGVERTGAADAVVIERFVAFRPAGQVALAVVTARAVVVLVIAANASRWDGHEEDSHDHGRAPRG